jgi:hypothetical protein
MSKRKQLGSPRASAPRAPLEPGDVVLTTTRIDPPHIITGAPSDAADDAPRASPKPAIAPAISLPGYSPSLEAEFPASAFTAPALDGLALEQLQNQATQLAAQLSKQQATLDHREAELNARAAAVESQVRAARLWLAEKLDLLAHHKGDLPPWAHDETGFANAASLKAGLPADSFGSEETPEQRTDDPLAPLSHASRLWKQERWQEEFERWRLERAAATAGADEAAASSLTHDPATEPATASVYRRKEVEERIATTEQRIASRSAELEAKRAELVADRKTFEAEREAFFVQRQEERWRLAEQRRTMSEKLMRQRVRLRRRRDDFDAREMALRQLRADLLRAQHQTLEMRLAAEELWARLRGKGAAADIAASRINLHGPDAHQRHEGAA